MTDNEAAPQAIYLAYKVRDELLAVCLGGFGRGSRGGNAAVGAACPRARLVRHTPGPTCAAGDFHNGSWLKTTHQLVAEGPAQNVRVGRRFYPTFDARMPLMRWLLDHFSVSPQFRVAALKWPPAVGSDSFPLLVGLVSSRE